MVRNKKSVYEGLQNEVRGMKTPHIEIWENKYPDKEYTVKVETGEFTCVCPKTGLPDFAHIYIEYSPARSCVELKSFKEYLMSYRDRGIFHEHLANRVLDDFVRACRPRWARIRTEFNVRGGIKTVVEASYTAR